MSPAHIDSSPREVELLSLFDSFLIALCDPEGGDALYGLHTADAAVRLGTGIGPAAETDRDRFAHAHREIGLRGQDVLPKFSGAALLDGPADPAADESVAWFEVTETREQRR